MRADHWDRPLTENGIWAFPSAPVVAADPSDFHDVPLLYCKRIDRPCWAG